MWMFFSGYYRPRRNAADRSDAQRVEHRGADDRADADVRLGDERADDVREELGRRRRHRHEGRRRHILQNTQHIIIKTESV